ncbi:MAG: type II secretion system protein [Planctomycetota bacterium]|nr:type II secretion system protein [Planctomycetota bacterium]MDA1113479.1 type II secretion system protein [Planctomycetota bacterium]
MKIKKKNGFTLIEVSIAVVLIVLVGTSAIASLRVGMRTMNGTQAASVAASAIREFREFTFNETIDAMDLRDDTVISPVLGDGSTMPGVDGMTLSIDVQAVDDIDPTVAVGLSESRTRIVTIVATSDEKELMEALWLIAEH